MGEPVRHHGMGVTHTSFSADGKALVSTGTDGVIKLWSTATGDLIRQWPSGDGWGICAFLYARKSRVVSLGRDRVLRFWDAKTGVQRATIMGLPEAFADFSRLPCARVSTKRDRLLISVPDQKDERILRIDLLQQKRLPPITIAGGRITAFDLTKDGRDILVLQDNHFSSTILRLRRRQKTNELIYRATCEQSTFLQLIDHDTEILVAGRVSSSFLDASTGGERTRLKSLLSEDMRWNTGRLMICKRDGSEVFTSHFHSVEAFDPETDTSETRISLPPGSSNLTLSPDETLLVASAKTIRFFAPETGAELNRTRGHQGEVTAVAFSPDGAHLISSSGVKGAQIWNTKSGKPSVALSPAPANPLIPGIMHTGFTQKGHAITASAEAKIRIYDASGEIHRTIDPGQGKHLMTGMRICDNGIHAVSVLSSGDVCLVNLDIGKVVEKWLLPSHRHPLSIAAESKRVAIAIQPAGNAKGSNIFVYETGKRDPVALVERKGSNTTSIRFVGQSLVIGDNLGDVSIHDIGTGLETRRKRVMERAVRELLRTSDDASLIAIGISATDGTRVVRLDAKSLKDQHEILELPGVAYAADLDRLSGKIAIGMANGTVVICDPTKSPATKR
ncbi:MAG: WD40 repeat domain-containing protein [bacterium]|nr:WD40 repeat domain-containing protein [bacterium]